MTARGAAQPFTIRPARPDDVGAVLTLIRELAEFERLVDTVAATESGLRSALFGAKPVAEALVAEAGVRIVGYAVYFPTFSTFLGKPGIYVEDLYVSPDYRRHGIGRTLMRRIAQIANDRGCGRLEWSVLNWNERAIAFYRSIGAVPLDEWTMYRLTGVALEKFAKGTPV